MEIAAVRLWDALRIILLKCKPDTGRQGGPFLAAICGSGNNAGDALAVLRNAVFAGFSNCVAILCRDDPGSLASERADSLRALGIPVLSLMEKRKECATILADAGLIIDGIAGTGVKGLLRGTALEALNLMEGLLTKTDSGPSVAAIDLPSGLADLMSPDARIVRADWTLSVEPRKQALYYPAFRGSCGNIVPIDGIFPVDSRPSGPGCLLEARDLSSLLQRDCPWLYKGSRGRLAVFAGGKGTTGAASLCARAGLASGAGYVVLYADPELTGILAGRLEEIMVRASPEPVDSFRSSCWDAVLAGPGWAENEKNSERLRFLLECGLPLVLDAGAVVLYRELHEKGLSPKGPVILTPHPGECARLCNRSAAELLADPAGILPGVAARLGAHIVFKSHVTWIVAPDGEMRIWDGLESGLGTAGSGDVLAGLIGGLLARQYAGIRESGEHSWTAGDAALRAACAGVLAHGLSGRSLRVKEGWFAAGRLAAEAARILGSPFSGVDAEQQ